MLKAEIIKRSPIRILEKSIHGGLGKGNLGVFVARKGVGKTACLVHFATDNLLRGHKALHISFSDDPQHIEHWYTQVYHEIARAYKLADAMEIYEEIIRNRLILHFKRTGLNLDAVRSSVARLIQDSSFQPQIIIVDGFAFDKASDSDLNFWKQLATDHQAEIWFSATLPPDAPLSDTAVVPAPIAPFQDILTVIILLIGHRDYIELKLLKDHEEKGNDRMQLRLDPGTLLIANRRV
ncbi:MAG TPA: AAA family ATPase [bacterium]|nr:AAA family ATPase [bacterium]HPR86462.1 AAA family ATPase [bacterium]